MSQFSRRQQQAFERDARGTCAFGAQCCCWETLYDNDNHYDAVLTDKLCHCTRKILQGAVFIVGYS